MAPRPTNTFAPYRSALQALSTRTGTALPSLIVSFAILHEATALVPLVGGFFGARALGVGERVVQLVREERGEGQPGWVAQRARAWIDEGEHWAGRVGRRYGIWGFAKRDQEGREDPDVPVLSSRIAGDVANAVVAYGAVKALMPLRVVLSLYLAPSFSRRIVDPLSSSARRIFRRHPPAK